MSADLGRAVVHLHSSPRSDRSRCTPGCTPPATRIHCDYCACNLTVIANSSSHREQSDLSDLLLLLQSGARGEDQLPQSAGRSQHRPGDQVKLGFTIALRFMSQFKALSCSIGKHLADNSWLIPQAVLLRQD